jgi:hypothetical protein
VIGVRKIDLVRTNAERADCQQAMGLRQNPRIDLGLGSDSQDVNVANALKQFLLFERVIQPLDLISFGSEGFICARMDVLEQKNFDFRLGKRRYGQGHLATLTHLHGSWRRSGLDIDAARATPHRPRTEGNAHLRLCHDASRRVRHRHDSAGTPKTDGRLRACSMAPRSPARAPPVHLCHDLELVDFILDAGELAAIEGLRNRQ